MRPPEDTIADRGYTIEVHRDDDNCDADEALSGDCATVFAWHRRYRFGGDPPSWATEAMEEGRLHEAILEHFPDAIILPLFMYEHSGIALSTGAFGCPWDSGQLGVIFTTEPETEGTVDGIAVKYGGEHLLRAIVQEMDNRVQGNVWGFVVKTPEGDDLDSCWGYVGDDRDYMLSIAREAIERDVKARESGERLVAECFAL